MRDKFDGFMECLKQHLAGRLSVHVKPTLLSLKERGKEIGNVRWSSFQLCCVGLGCVTSKFVAPLADFKRFC